MQLRGAETYRCPNPDEGRRSTSGAGRHTSSGLASTGVSPSTASGRGGLAMVSPSRACLFSINKQERDQLDATCQPPAENI